MKKVLFFAATAAVLLTSCVKVENTQKVADQGTPVSFGVYVPMTKAGTGGTLTTNGAGGTTSLYNEGFGVFAYYSDHATYSPATGPNFMYNQKVDFNSISWVYTPVKYWPNETINDSNSATGPSSTDADKLSFFAYAPYVTCSAAGAVSPNTEGITGLTANTNTTTDPRVAYKVATDPSKAVDLCWAVAPAGGFSYTDVHGASVSVDSGRPLINLTKPNTTQTIPFLFKHATSRLNLKVVGAYDQVAVGGTLAAETKVTVEKVELTTSSYSEGTLNLNNTTVTDPGKPNWEDLSGSPSTLVVTGTNLNTAIKYGETAANVGSDPANMQNVMADNTFFTLIPKAGDQTVEVKITYYVTTEDTALNGGQSEIQNVITKTVTFTGGFEAGKAYTIAMVLGLTSVKLEASVADWDDVAPSYVDLPINH